MLRKCFIAVFLFCTLWNIVTALPPRTVVTTKWPSLTSSNPKCPTIPLWKDLKPTIQDLTAKNLLPPDFQLKLLRTLDEQIKKCEDEIVELEAEDIQKKNNVETDEKSNANDEEIVNDENIEENTDENIYETEDLEEINEDLEEDPAIQEEENVDYELENVKTTTTISSTTTEKPQEIKSLFANLPTFLPIFKPRAIVTARKVNTVQNSTLAAKENSNKKSQDKQEHPPSNNVIIQLAKTPKFEPTVNTVQAKQVSNEANTELKTMNTHNPIVSETPKTKNSKPVASLSSTTIPRTNIIHLNSNSQQSFPPNSAFVINPGTTNTCVNFSGNNPSQNLPSNGVFETPGVVTTVASAGPHQGIAFQDDCRMQNIPINQISTNPSIVTPAGSPAANIIPVNTNCNSIPSNIAQNCPCPNPVQANMASVANTFPINAPLHSLPQNFIPSNTETLAVPINSFPQNCIPSNTETVAVPINSLPQNVIPTNTAPYSLNTVIPTCNSYSRNVASNQCSCSLLSNHVSPVPLSSFSHIPSRAECKEINRKCIERSQKPNVVFFKPEDVEILNVQGDLLKKMKMTVLVPTYVTQIDV